MKQTLHIFGCSHSMGRFPYAEPGKFWADIVAEHFELKRFRRAGHGGRNVEYILFDIYDRILHNDIEKNDVVILNTSYPLRFGTPRLEDFKKHPVDTHLYRMEAFLNGKFKQASLNFGMQRNDQLSDELMFFIWYIQTFAAYTILKTVCDRVYQWSLHDIINLDAMYASIQEKIIHQQDNLTEKLGLSFFPDRVFYNKNTWENLILCPTEYVDWDDFIYKHSPDYELGHIAAEHHKTQADLFIVEIERIGYDR